MIGVTINTQRLTLKSPVNNITADDLLAAINYEETLKYLSAAPKNYTIDNAKSFLNYLLKAEDFDNKLELGAFEKLSEKYIGMISLGNINYGDFTCELGYWISKPYTGKGLAFEGCTQLINFAFGTLNMKRIDAFVIKENTKSIALLERLGFEQIELLLKNEENDGVLVDRYKYLLYKPI